MQGKVMTWICYAAGYVFITSGIMKLVVPGFKGMFAGLGLPFPDITLFLVALLEVSCGMLIAGRMYIKQAAPPLIVIMIGAILITKIPIITNEGLLSFAFEARLDIVVLILLILIWKYVPGKTI
ncbi:DoxX family protein [Ralstonia pickettii]|nr:DoxX family protein [Ralstonia pickettii]